MLDIQRKFHGIRPPLHGHQSDVVALGDRALVGEDRFGDGVAKILGGAGAVSGDEFVKPPCAEDLVLGVHGVGDAVRVNQQQIVGAKYDHLFVQSGVGKNPEGLSGADRGRSDFSVRGADHRRGVARAHIEKGPRRQFEHPVEDRYEHSGFVHVHEVGVHELHRFAGRAGVLGLRAHDTAR